MVEPITVPDKLKKVIAILEAMTKGFETIKKEQAAPLSVPVTKIKPK